MNSFHELADWAARQFLRGWVRCGVVPGYAYQAVERYGRRLASRPLPALLADGSLVHCRLDDHIQRQMYFFGAYEPIEAFLFRELLAPGMVVIDAGANVGQYALMAARRVGPNGRVHAFEPIPANIRELEANLSTNRFSGRVAVTRAALWDTVGRLSLYLDAADSHDNATDYTAGERAEAADILEVPTTTLDAYVRSAGVARVDVMKIDIEGAELMALRGASELLRAFHPTLLIELNRPNCLSVGYDPVEIEALLREHGYRFWLIGIHPRECGELTSFAGVERANLICHTRPLPDAVTSGWTYRRIVRAGQPACG